MVKTREAVRNARGPLMILLLVSVLGLALHQEGEREPSASASETAPEAAP